jgi:hypothetical protein
MPYRGLFPRTAATAVAASPCVPSVASNSRLRDASVGESASHGGARDPSSRRVLQLSDALETAASLLAAPLLLDAAVLDVPPAALSVLHAAFDS